MPVLLLLVLVGGPLLLMVIALTAHSLSRGRVDTSEEWRWVRGILVAAVILGVGAASLVVKNYDLGRGTMLAPAVLGLFIVAGVGLAETVVRPLRPSGPRTASLTARRVSDYLPRTLATAVLGITTLHLATLALTTATASSDDLRRAGRQIAAQCGSIGSAAGPYPGSFYAVPLILLLLVVGLVAGAALSAVVRRPRGFAPDDVTDDVLRHRSTTRVLAAAGAAVSASHVGIAFFAGTALLRLDCQSVWMDPVGWMLLASIPATLLLLGWFLGRTVAPGTMVAAAQAAQSL